MDEMIRGKYEHVVDGRNYLRNCLIIKACKNNDLTNYIKGNKYKNNCLSVSHDCIILSSVLQYIS